MNILLDTATLFWWCLDKPILSARARAAILDPENTVYISAVTSLEFSVKSAGDRWTEARPVTTLLPRLFTDWRFDELPIRAEHAIYAGAVCQELVDPFDALLAAQTVMEKLFLVTADLRLTHFLKDRAFW